MFHVNGCLNQFIKKILRYINLYLLLVMNRFDIFWLRNRINVWSFLGYYQYLLLHVYNEKTFELTRFVQILIENIFQKSAKWYQTFESTPSKTFETWKCAICKVSFTLLFRPLKFQWAFFLTCGMMK